MDNISSQTESEIFYGLEDKPPFFASVFAALQHLLAIFVPIITPTLIIAGAMKLDIATSSYLVSMSLLISGVATWIQVRKVGALGSGLLSIQGTSFTFLDTCISIGEEKGLAGIFGTAIAGSPVEMIISRFLPYARKIITPLVSGIVVTMIGMSLIKVGIIDCAGGFAAKQNGTFGDYKYLAISGLVFCTIVLCNRCKNPFLRMSSIVIGMATGYIITICLGWVSFQGMKNVEYFSIPIPFRYGISFSFSGFLAMLLLYIITTIESLGDITATSMVSRQPIEGDVYFKRISGGVLADGFNSFLAGVFNTFPNTTFSQNNGIIQLTGVASRHIGYYIASFLVILGLFPVIGALFSLMPEPVLGGATIIMFGTIAAAGIKIIASNVINRRNLLIIALSFSLGLGVTFEPDILSRFPALVGSLFSSGITTGGLSAILLNIVLPYDLAEKKVEKIKEEIGI